MMALTPFCAKSTNPPLSLTESYPNSRIYKKLKFLLDKSPIHEYNYDS